MLYSQLFSAFLSFSQLFSAFLSFSQLFSASTCIPPIYSPKDLETLWEFVGSSILGHTHIYIYFSVQTACLSCDHSTPIFSKNHQVLGSPMQHLPVEVLICACDTFRAGAVEQLKTHSRWTSCAGVACCKTSK